MGFELYPAIDLKDGQAVRLLQGRMEDATVYNPDPAAAAQQWVEQGARWIHVVDLNGAFAGASRNVGAVRAIVQAAGRVPVQLGGGLRSLEAIEAVLAAGVGRIIIGTRALDGDLVAQAVDRFGADRIVVGIDAKGGMVATDGWVNVTDVKATDLATRVARAGVQTVIYTDIAKDGMMAGPNFAEMEAMGGTGVGIIASGGVSSLNDVRRLMGIAGVTGAILGKAIYTGAIELPTALQLTAGRIYVISQRAVWELGLQAGVYRRPDLQAEGFMHASGPEQVVRTANKHYRGQQGLVLLAVDSDRLTVPLKYEAASSGDLYPHIYGPIDPAAVVDVIDFSPGPDGLFTLPDQI